VLTEKLRLTASGAWQSFSSQPPSIDDVKSALKRDDYSNYTHTHKHTPFSIRPVTNQRQPTLTPQRQLTTQKHARYIHCVSTKNIPDITDCNFKKNSQISIILGTNIPDTRSHLTNVCFCTTSGKQNKQTLHYYFIKITHINNFVHISVTLVEVYLIIQLANCLQ